VLAELYIYCQFSVISPIFKYSALLSLHKERILCNFMHCTSCDTLLQPGTRICPSCGASLATIGAQPDVNPYDDDVPFVEERIATRVLIPAVQKPSSLEAAFLASSASVALPVQKVDEPPASKRRSWVLVNLMLFCLLVLLVAGESGGLLVYEHNFRSNVLPAEETRTARNLVTTQVEKTAVANMQATATATAMTPQQLYAWATSGTPVIDDPLDKHEGMALIETDLKKASCRIQDAAYHMRMPTSSTFSCTVPGSFFHDLAFQVQITIIQGETGGIFLRASNSSSYFAYIDAGGHYALSVLKDGEPNILKAGNSAKLGTGRGYPHLLTVIARGSTLYLYLDKDFIDQVIDTSSAEGQVGLLASSDQGPTDVAFQNVKIWGL
jgi:hypothetical protein